MSNGPTEEIVPLQHWASTSVHPVLAASEREKLHHFYVCVVLDGGSQNHFAGIRFQFGRHRRGYTPSGLTEVREVGSSCPNTAVHGSATADVYNDSTRLPLLNVVVRFSYQGIIGPGNVIFEYPSYGHQASGSDSTKNAPNFIVLHESIHLFGENPRTTLLFEIHWESPVERFTGIRRPRQPGGTPALVHSKLTAMYMTRILPLQPADRLTSQAHLLPPDIIKHIVDLTIDPSSTSWASQLLGFSLIHRSWSHATNLFWERIGRRSGPVLIQNPGGVAAALRRVPGLGHSIHCFRLGDFTQKADQLRLGSDFDASIASFIHQVKAQLQFCILDCDIFEINFFQDTYSAVQTLNYVEQLKVDLGCRNLTNLGWGSGNVADVQLLIRNWKRLRSLHILNGARKWDAVEMRRHEIPSYSLEWLNITRSHTSGGQLRHFVANQNQRLRAAYFFRVSGLTDDDLYDFLSATSATLTYLTLLPSTVQLKPGCTLALDRCIHRMEGLQSLNVQSDLLSEITICRKGIKAAKDTPRKDILSIHLEDERLAIKLPGAIKESEWDEIVVDYYEWEMDDKYETHLEDAKRCAQECGIPFQIRKLTREEGPADFGTLFVS